MLPILITGHERSGTTLLRRLVSMHPDLEYDLVHEGWQLDQFKSAEDAELRYKVRMTQAGKITGAYASVKAGEKVPYGHNLRRIKEYIILWKRYWADSLIFHIVRQPSDVVRSCWKTFKVKTNEREVTERVDKMSLFLTAYSRVVAISYDVLVDDAENELRRIYNVMGRVPDDEYMHKVLHTQDSWKHNGRIMSGLRYRDYVGRV